ncbi:MAG: IPT/TIG domain-containing protein [Chloroflexi bacterium]|nr:IPT/TIG domain-containing protein [Chloroflexota bacterium]
MKPYSDISHYFWRTRAKFSAVVALTLALSYGGGLWLQVLHSAIGAVERNEPPPVIHWLRDSMLMMPLIFVAVWASILLARRALMLFGRGASRFMSGAAVVSVIAVTTSAVIAVASPGHNVVFQANHHVGGEEMPLLAHMWLEGLLALVANLAISAIVYIVLRGRLWTARLPGRSRPVWTPIAARRLLAVGQIGLLLLSIIGASPNNLVTAAPASLAGGANAPCPAGAPLKTFDVSAIDVTMWLNRFGDHDPNAQMLVLNSMIPAVQAQVAAGPSSLSIGLRDDPIQPLAIRANQGDCVIINFTNATAQPAPGATSNNYGLHIDGLAFQISSSGDGIGNNPLSSVPAGGTITYTYWIPNDPTLEGAHYIHPGPGNRQAVAHGLFGTLNVEPPGSVYLNMTTGQPLLSGWEAIIVPGSGKSFRENVKVFHEIGNESERNIPVDINGNSLPTLDPHTGAYRPGSRAINYRSESFMDRLNVAEDQKSVVYGSYTFGDTTNIIPRGYLGDPTKFRLVHGGSEVFHVYHLHGGSDRWRFNPKADPTYDYSKTGLDKHPVEVQSESARLDSQSIGPGESFDLEIENGAGGAQQGAGEFLFHCHIAHHYFSGMWGYWRVYDTLQPDLAPLPDRAPLPQAVNSSALIGKTINGQTITAQNLDAWIRPQLPTQGVTHDINVATRDTADQDASVWDWAVDNSTGLYLGEPDRLTPNWPDYANVVPGHPMALMVDQTVQSTYLLNGSPVTFSSGGYIGDRPKILFNPTNGRPAWPLLRPHIGKRPPFSPNGHSGAPYLGEYGGTPPDPALSIDPWANRSDGICPAGAPLRTFNVVGLAVPIQITKAGQIDPLGALDVLAQDKDAVYANSKVYAGVQHNEPLAIRGNIGDCLAVTYVSELTDGGNEVPYSKTNIHIHHVQFDTQASDGVISGFSFEQSIRPYKIVDPQLTAAANPGEAVLHLSSVAKFQNGVWIAIGMGTEGIEIRQITAINNAASTVTLNKPVANAHPADEWAGVEFVQYRWYPDVELDNIFFHDHVNGIHGWSHGMVGQLVIEPFGSTYHDPVTGAEIKSGAIADIHTDPNCVPNPDNPNLPSNTTNQCALIPGVIDGSFREFVLWTINDHDPIEATLNLRAEPWSDRSLDPALRFSSNSPQGDPYTPLFRAYLGDPVVIRNINVGQGTNVLHIDGHRTFWEPRYRDALGVESSPIDAFHSTVSEKYTLILDGGAGGPNHVPGDYIYHDGENRRFQSGAWGILRVLPGPVSDLQPLPSVNIPAQQPTCPANAPIHTFNISAVDLPSTSAGGGDKGRKAAFVPNTDVTAVLNKTKFPEPLVLHVAAGQCVKVSLTNRRSTARVSFHLGGLLRDMNSTGINVGFNPEQTIGKNASRTYTFYADNPKLESVLISDFGGDNSGWDGLYGAIVVAPTGATFKNPTTGQSTDTGSQVNVFAPGQAPYRDFTLLLADQDPRIGQNTMPYPADVDGPALINYRTAGIRQDDANMFSSLTYGDPTTPLLRAYAGDPVKVHVLGAPASEQVHVFTLGGMSWPGDMYVHNASQWQNRAVGPWEKIDILVSGGAGGVAQVPGDYFYGDIRRPFTQAGMWGLFRVLTNTCATSGIAGLPCLTSPAPAPAPTVTGLSPTSGAVAGGTSVAITGTNFSTTPGATTVRFGANAATNVSCLSTTACTATSPAGSGVVDVVVTVGGQSSAINNSDLFTYVTLPPTVTGVSPNSGPAAGGTVVSITGTNFTPGAISIKFGANVATGVSCSNATNCTATSPAGSGVVDVVVTVNGQSSATSNADKFTYIAPPAAPTVTAIKPNKGPAAGGTVVTITGTGFSTTAGATGVKFGANVATNVSCTSTTTCKATSPAGTRRTTVDVIVTVGGQSSAISSADKFTYTR